jgi:very-short-patch-repair endonuclease
VIELDGEIHQQQLEYDIARTKQLSNFGYQIIRFSNQEVITNLNLVLNQILEASHYKA